jgi:hypothetical protein
MTGGDEAQPPGDSSGDSVLVWVQDFDGYTLSINAAHRAVLGWSLDELSAVRRLCFQPPLPSGGR